MQHLEVSFAVRPIQWPLGVKWLKQQVLESFDIEEQDIKECLKRRTPCIGAGHTQPAFAEYQRRPERQTGISYCCMTPISHSCLQPNLNLLEPSIIREVEIQFCQITYAVQSVCWAQLQFSTNLSLPNARSSNRRPFQQILSLYTTLNELHSAGDDGD